MAVAVSQSDHGSPSVAPPKLMQAFGHLLGGLFRLEAVRRVAISAAADELDIWVMTASEDLGVARQVFELEYDFRRVVGPAAVSLNIVPLTEVDPAALPPVETLFDR